MFTLVAPFELPLYYHFYPLLIPTPSPFACFSLAFAIASTDYYPLPVFFPVSSLAFASAFTLSLSLNLICFRAVP